MILEVYKDFCLGNTIKFTKEYANQLAAKKEFIKCFNMIENKSQLLERKVLTMPKEKTNSGLVIETIIPVKNLNFTTDDFYHLDKKIISKRGIKIEFFNTPDNFRKAFSLLNEYCVDHGIDASKNQMMELATLDKNYYAKSFCILLDLRDGEYVKAEQ